MAIRSKINPKIKTNQDTGFGVQVNQIGGRFVNKDGSFNVRKTGLPPWYRMSLYSSLLELSSWSFILVVLLAYGVINVIYTVLYLLLGNLELQGLAGISEWDKIKEVFFFSTQTFTTVGYGRINPDGDMANVISAVESLSGLLFFAFVTGILYGRFTKPKAYIMFSENALISPYREGTGLMFRLVPYKDNHFLTDARITVNISVMLTEDDKPTYNFYQLKLERSRIDALNMNWTVVHPIDEDSPLLNFNSEDLERADLEMYVQLTGFDDIFSNMVMQRTSYTFREIIWGAKFVPMYQMSEDGNTTILQLDKLNEFAEVDIRQKV